VSKESKIIVNVIPLDVEHEMEYSLCHGLETHICRGGGVGLEWELGVGVD